MTKISCPADGCDYETDTGRGVSIHASQKHPDKDISFTNKDTFTCPECKEDFEDYKSRRSSKGEENNFCSRDCKDEFEKNGEVFECSWCGSDTYKPQSSIGKSSDNYSIDNHFCDKSCEQSWKRQHWAGEGHPSWNGGSPSYRGKSWPEMRRKTIDRDGYTCKVCDISRAEHYEQYGRDLDVHHKIPSRTFEQVDDANYPINLVTTCMSCHGKLDKISRREADRKPTISV